MQASRIIETSDETVLAKLLALTMGTRDQEVKTMDYVRTTEKLAFEI